MSPYPSHEEGQPEPQPAQQPVEPARDRGEERRSGPSRLLRSYALTGGRTTSASSSLELGLETLVSVTILGESAPGLSLERRSIVQMCRSPISVAEVSAHLDVPLGVARVLLGDMAEEGMITVHRAAVASDETPDVALLQRVLAGLRTL